MTMTAEDLEQLREARRLLESPSFAVRITELIGRPIEKGIGMLPDKTVRAVQGIVHSALERAVDVAAATIPSSSRTLGGDRMHRLATATTGAVGGFFGLPGVAVELPLTTVIMLRSIADIARSEGHDLSAAETRLSCLEVFALGGPGSNDDAAETGYYTVRAGLAQLVSEAAQHVATRGLTRRGAPVIVQFINKIASRFGIVVQEKVALEMIPAIGAVSGALLNTVFMGHFQNIARGHFVVKRLESRYGVETVRKAYESVKTGRSTR